MSPQTPTVQRYRLVERLGQGGMGVVWRARDEVLDREVAVKEIVPPAGLPPQERDALRRRTRREARAAARLNHPNVVRVYDVLDEPDWIVMEYVPSRSLEQVLAEDGPLPVARVAAIGLDVLAALESAHRAGVLHRDVKPGNVLLADDGRVVLTDFGLATMTGDAAVTLPGLVFGSPGYIAPERARGEPGTAESDLWSLGATLFAAVEGRGPFDRDSAIATLHALATEPPGPAPRAGALRPVLNGLLRKEPKQRLRVADVRRRLQKAVTAPELAPPRRTRKAVLPVPQSPPAPASAAPSGGLAPAAPPPPAQVAPVGVAPVGVAPVVAPPARVGLPPRRGPALAIAVLALLALAVAFVALLPRDQPAAPQTAPSPSTAPATTPATDPSAAVPPPAATDNPPPPAGNPPGNQIPAGWHLYRDPTGFAVAVPNGWNLSREGTIVYFRDPAGGRVLGIDQSNQPKSDPVADWTAQESYRVRRGDFPQYERIGITRCQYFLACADWEFRYTSGGTRIHANNRGLVASSTKAYGIWWSTPDSRWAESRPMLDVVYRTLVPSG